MAGTTMREVLLHGGMDEAFDRSVVFARQLAESFGARLHVVYTLEDPLSAGWTAEVSAGPADEEVVRYTNEHPIDLAIVHAPADKSSDLAHALIDRGRCAVLVLR